MDFDDYNEAVANRLTDAGVDLPADLREVTWMTWNKGRPPQEVAQSLIEREKAKAPGAVAEEVFEVELALGPAPKCKHCGRDKGRHRAHTMQCPIGRGSFPSYHPKNVYEPRKARKRSTAPVTEQKADVGLRDHALLAAAPMVASVVCPVCGEPEMRKETDAEGQSLIFCVNHYCASNGGTNASRLARRLELKK